MQEEPIRMQEELVIFLMG